MPKTGPFVCLLVALLVGVRAASAEDFRIETKVYTGKETDAESHNVTLFRAGVVYDFLLAGPERVAVFDRSHGRFILLDPQRKVKTEVKTDDLLAFTQKLQQWAANRPNGYLKFQAEPKFDVKIDKDQENDLHFTSPYVNYRVEGIKARSAEVAEQFREFSDWYARLNAMVNPGSNPPFARLAVNEELARRELVARHVQLTIPAQFASAGRSITLRSEHRVAWKLLERDLDRIAKTGSQMATFTSVSFDEYHQVRTAKR